MRRLAVATAGLGLLCGSAFAQTSATYVTDEGTLFPPSTLQAAQSPIPQTESFGNGKFHTTTYSYDFGNGFKTEVEGLSSTAASQGLGGLGTSGSLTSTHVTLKSMYEFSDGEWHLKPYVGAGFGVTDVNEQILGVTARDWAGAYQLRGGVSLGFTQKLLGSLEYRWAMGSKPHFSLAGIPTNLEVDRHGFVLGVNYKY
jgi:opacity protein-like surface antigen